MPERRTMAPLVLVVTGPTATGKTAVGVRLAELLNGEVVSADSMQIYRGLIIGTAAPTSEEIRGIPHHMVGCVSPTEPYSAARYVREATVCCDDILLRGKLPIIVGGTGLYIDSLLAGRDFAENGDGSLRRELSTRYDSEGGESLLSELRERDPESAARLHPNDKKRIVRALEICRLTGTTITEHDRQSRLAPPRYDSVRVALSFVDRQKLYDRIDRRVDRMMERGLSEEVRELLALCPDGRCTALQAIGYKELAESFALGWSPEEAADRIRQASRRYAKRQLSWLRRDPGLHWILWDTEPDPERAAREIVALYNRYRKEHP